MTTFTVTDTTNASSHFTITTTIIIINKPSSSTSSSPCEPSFEVDCRPDENNNTGFEGVTARFASWLLSTLHGRCDPRNNT
jgi:hypothetical protein